MELEFEMANGTEVANGDSTVASADNDENANLLSEAVRSLPAQAVKDLSSIGVCIRCICRLFGIHEGLQPCASLILSNLCEVVGKETGLEEDQLHNGFTSHEGLDVQHPSQDLAMEMRPCSLCLGILQFIYCNDKDELITRDSANGFALEITKEVKREFYQFENFSLEVSLPPLVVENEEAVRLYIKKKYVSELLFQEKYMSKRVSTKDVLKLSITDSLETLLGVKSGTSSFRVRLAYTASDAFTNGQKTTEKDQCNKRRKTGANDVEDVGGSVVSDCPKVLLEKVNRPCHLEILCYRTPIYIGGRYLKYSRKVSQTRWIIDEERKGEASVEEIIGDNILPMCLGDSYKFHAAGREDIDVRMLGSGRPFLVEIQNARHVPSTVSIKGIERKLNSVENNFVKVKNLKVLGSQGWSLMREGEVEKQKQYAALVWISRPLDDDDLRTISFHNDLHILQRTPIRVLHRRSPLDREKVIHWMNIERIAGSSQYFLLHLCTQAGTYIKEFVHGDLGRTHPSVGSILGCRAEILQLDVTDVKMDCFLDE